ncbi:hypothetical protein H696_04980 [Fonticula alba]|uniref:Squalene monooxygenase n=1 Tax=Fonticula alba TaxID=691883 RepID=A0A058Z591_FONAL|nr:hypothetical protein H696_04980 [Fonticula alba]KCV68692.1 hypothetical protein H696_04980 [Fonticula alba]|eukprot:XP_009497124.1 hypothetical protein H696_04980 [Fonticula alba]
MTAHAAAAAAAAAASEDYIPAEPIISAPIPPAGAPPVKYDAIVAGAGIAGASLAYNLARDGRRVLLLERDLRDPDTFRGELLQPGGVRALQRMGLGQCIAGIDAQACHGYVVYRPKVDPKSFESQKNIVDGSDTHIFTQIPYPSDKDHIPNTPATGYSFHHGRLVGNLRRRAAAHPNITIVEANVVDLLEDGPAIIGVKYRQKNEAGELVDVIAHGDLNFDCCGSFSRFRAKLSFNKPVYRSHFAALLLRDVPLPLPNHGMVIMCNSSLVLCYAISPRELRMLIDIPDPLPTQSDESLARYLLAHILPQLPSFLHGPFREQVIRSDGSPIPIRSVPCQLLTAGALIRPGVFCLGDSLNMRHPLTGSGMTVAFTDVLIVSDLLRPLDTLADTGRVIQALSSFYATRRRVSASMNILAQALYDVFCGGGGVRPSDEELLQFPPVKALSNCPLPMFAPSLRPLFPPGADLPNSLMAPAERHILPMVALRNACFRYVSRVGTDCLGILGGITPNPIRLLVHFFAVAIFSVVMILFSRPSPRSVATAFSAFMGASNIIFPLIWDHMFATHSRQGPDALAPGRPENKAKAM